MKPHSKSKAEMCQVYTTTLSNSCLVWFAENSRSRIKTGIRISSDVAMGPVPVVILPKIVSNLAVTAGITVITF